MKLRKTGRIAIAGLAVAAALTMTACGSDDKDSDKPAKSTTTSQSTTAEAADNLPPVPTADELNAQLQRALDPNVPNEEKLEMIQGAEADPNLPTTLTQAYQQSGASIQVVSVAPLGDTISATTNFVINGQTNEVTVPFVAEDGKWKVQQQWACDMLTAASMQSPACPA
ncbi:hypothetical protein [Nocardia cyriacigeorgica]|uniref:hypothetical protein n=1 Tax=Nocardia cyriacigeorgica TaxID=135487 RepID=UPI00189384E5|nr:hypothetical protein [Nocardia cyriacigeorgica]MBF6286574.1 hypothetical protein [Nocardia cyriacigeorgica]BDT86280.1 hypothetical protein FMUAM8_20440 [Nocardia cyriacigeorgica]